jgi:hypothetical protein
MGCGAISSLGAAGAPMPYWFGSGLYSHSHPLKNVKHDTIKILIALS